MNKQYKVLHVFSAYGGGIGSLILNLTENKSDNFIFDTIAFSYKGGEGFVERLEKMGTTCYSMPSAKRKPVQFFKYIDELFGKNHYDAVHCHIAGWMSIPFKNMCKKYGIKTFIVHAHTTKYDSKIDRIPLVYKLDKSVNYKVATDYMTCSDIAGNYIFGKEFLEKREALLIPNGVKKELFEHILTEEEKDNYRKEIGLPENKKLILHVGRFSEAKNHPFIVELAKEIDKEKKYMIAMVGDGGLWDEMVKNIELNNLSESLKLLGRRSDISSLMQVADCMILPSYNEGLPTTAVECQASGTPMVLSDTITTMCDMGLDLVQFIKTDDAAKWVGAIEELMDKKMNPEIALAKVEANGFTATSAAKLYCDALITSIERNEK